MKVLVTGASGFVGTNVAMLLAHSEYEVSLGQGKSHYDLLDIEATKRWLGKVQPNVIINCAANIGSVHYVANNAADVIFSNTQMVLNLYNAVKTECPGVKIINPLGNCAYPGDAEVQRESELWDGEVHDSVHSYGNFKRYLYVISSCYEMQYGIQSVNLIAPNAYGPEDDLDPNKTHALNGMIIRMLKARNNGDDFFEIWGTGKPIREWLYVEDLAQILINAIDIDTSTYPVNIAQHKGHSIEKSAKTIARVIGYSGELVFNTTYRDGDPCKILDDTVFKRVFGEYKFTDHVEGIKETVRYYENRL